MELALSLGGDSSKPFKFLDNTITSSSSSNIKDLGFCMGLSVNSTSGFTPPSQDNKTHLHLHYNTHQDHDDHRDGGDDSQFVVNSSHDLPVQLDLLPSSPVHPSRPQIRFPWLSDHMICEPRSTERSGGRGFEVKRLSGEETEEGAALSSPNNSAGSSFQMDFGITKCNDYYDNKRERIEVSIEGDRGSDDEDNNISGLSRKKLRLSKDQSAFLEESFKQHNTLNPKQKLALAKQLNLRPRQVEVWFQNRRARTKLKQTEVDCDYLKRCCETLKEENKRLQKELLELRALKTSQPFYMQLPATTLTMCPSCERVATTTTTTSSSGTNNINPVASTTTNSTSLSLASNYKPKLSPHPFTSHAQAHLPQAQTHQAAS